MKNINPLNTKSWKQLKKHYKIIKNIHLNEMFINDKNRFNNFSLLFENKILVDFSKNRINDITLKLLLKLTKETYLSEAIFDFFNGKKINKTENRAVLHTALRSFNKKPLFYEGKNVYLKIKKVLRKMKIFSKKIIQKKWLGYTNKFITDIVNIGIGGSDLGPNMVIESLKPYNNHLKIHFVSNVDATQVLEVLKKISPDRTIFIICSKTFTTQETIINANSIKKWFLKYTNKKKDFKKHFFAVSTNYVEPLKFGIDIDNIFKFWDWVGGRYSLWSSVGLSIMLLIGYKNFIKFLQGAYSMDLHFLKTPFEKNIPVLLALISIWYNNFFNMETEAILPYDQYMNRFSSYFQQANMESNGKCFDRKGNKVNWQTGPIIWGESGTNSQHSFFQLLHQGTKIVPCDFIAPALSHNPLDSHHNFLLSNFFAQTQSLAFGSNSFYYKNINNINNNCFDKNIIYKTFEGNRPTNSILCKKITPYVLGALICMYEHKIFTQGIILNIYSFDQWGVELGKILANKIFLKLLNKSYVDNFDSSTNGLINIYKKWNFN
ncbi:glucose-6-phosphate isomerase [Buchnera aphidicola]|uniref:glucose-6-phosphate isomerase n=1 Tax=Buchnera aphidicola TaxID=9 RepID=UPI0031B85F3F